MIQALYVCGKNSAHKTRELAISYHFSGGLCRANEKMKTVGRQLKNKRIV